MMQYIKTLADKVNQEFPIDGEGKIFDELVAAVKRKIEYLTIISYENNALNSLTSFGTIQHECVIEHKNIDLPYYHEDLMKQIASLTPMILLGIYVTAKSHSDMRHLIQEKVLLTIADIKAYISEINHHPWIVNIANQALELALERQKSGNLSRDFIRYLADVNIQIAKIALKLGRTDIARATLDKLDSNDYASAATISYILDDLTLANDSLNKAWEESERFVDYFNAAEIAHKMENEELKIKPYIKLGKWQRFFTII